MKLMMFAALAAAVATPGLAQTTTPSTPTSDTTTMQSPAPTTPTTDPAMTNPATPAADPATSAPAPSSTMPGMPMNNSGMASSPAASDGSYPKCSRTVTDHCMENSNARGERKHSTPRPRR